MSSLALVWFRNDLRLTDNPALTAAISSGYRPIPVYIHDPDGEKPWAEGAASRWWRHHSLVSLADQLRKLGSRLIIRQGDSLELLPKILQDTNAVAVFWNRRYEPAVITRDRQIKSRLKSTGFDARSFNGSLLFEPWDIQNKQGSPFKVFTPFWKHCLAHLETAPLLPPPAVLPGPADWPVSLAVSDLRLLPTVDWAAGIRAAWQPGEPGALDELNRFVDEGLAIYAEKRDRPDWPGTSRLSPHLHFGEIGPRQIWQAVTNRLDPIRRRQLVEKPEPYLRQLGWREFAHHLLYHQPDTTHWPLRAEFQHFPWQPDAALLQKWQNGQTGYPIVDAGLRELWTTGWMHNRVRMIAASFLVKHLLQPWLAGAQWFWDTLVDADLANNTLGWQWVAGCGADAAPYFRIFNPLLQGKKFDPHGYYVRKWLPALRKLPDHYIHQPDTAPPLVLSEAGIKLGQDYPLPLVDHSRARQDALAAYRGMKNRKV